MNDPHRRFARAMALIAREMRARGENDATAPVAHLIESALDDCGLDRDGAPKAAITRNVVSMIAGHRVTRSIESFPDALARRSADQLRTAPTPLHPRVPRSET